MAKENDGEESFVTGDGEVMDGVAFSRMVQVINAGAMDADLTEEMHKLVREVRKCAPHAPKVKGTLTIKVTFAAENTSVLAISHDVSVKKPRRSRGAGMAFMKSNGQMTLKNPQEELRYPAAVPSRQTTLVDPSKKPDSGNEGGAAPVAN